MSGDKWYPLEEKDSVRVELEHCRDGWRNRVYNISVRSFRTYNVHVHVVHLIEKKAAGNS